MSQLMRFGRRIALPSTRQIRHELLTAIVEDERRKALKASEADLVPTPVATDLSTPPA